MVNVNFFSISRKTGLTGGNATTAKELRRARSLEQPFCSA
jgi:hypothetical protein